MTTQAEPSARPARVVLEGVPRAGFFTGGDLCPEDFPFPGSLVACLKYLGDYPGCQHASPSDKTWGLDCTYSYILGTSGIGFRLHWNPARWDMANGDIMHMAPDPLEPIHRAFEGIGLGCGVLLKTEYARTIGYEGQTEDGEELYRRRIVESLRDRGRPAIAVGVVGPPECCVVTGYDEGGDALLGWSFFQGFPEFAHAVEVEPSGYFRKRGWHNDTMGLILIGERKSRPPMGEVCRRALRWGLQVMRTPSVRGYHAGIAAYGAWAEALLRDEELAAGEYAVLNERYGVHYDAVGTVAEGRWYTAGFLKQAAKAEPAMAAELEAAAKCFEKEHDLMWDVWNLAAGNNWAEPNVRKWAEPEVRRQIVQVILEARDREAEAAQLIEQALGQ